MSYDHTFCPIVGTKIVVESGVTDSLHHQKILVVEDDPTYLRLWERLIHDLGVDDFVSAKHPEKALDSLNKKPVDLLISDIIMPHINGYELAKLARQKNPNIEILLTTGYQTDLSHFDLTGLRCHLLHKPYHNLQEVCRLLKKLIYREDVFQGMAEDSFSDNEDFPEITEWTL